MNFGSITRFAGDRVGGMFGSAYNAVDNQLGGILPGGVDVNAGGLVKNVVKDSLPGKRSMIGEAGAKKANSVAGHLASGDVDRAAVGTRAGAATGQLREHLVEEGVEAGAKALARRAGTFSIPVVGPVLGTWDTVNDAKNAYSSVLEATTGKNLDQHVDIMAQTRDKGRGLAALFPEAGSVMPSDGSIPEVRQGRQQNPIAQEVKARFNDAASTFNPLKGEWGLSEMLWGR
ncbi:hypothetical protein [Synechococcus sp. WH 8016]|uniref:hypothetical protein n=1 Tax=Synechococcus sp. WH 8016 TaxID=166318 RepID=UPI00022DA147|nr:hypothetical protein [Synechococcus sp. WH 8016]EHA63719.1 hypothetical protein Syn8016DRAFT_0760 [Synechococcus sp. WH 8016]